MTPLILATIFLLLGFFQHAAASVPASAVPQSLRIAGAVVDAASGQPLARATVVLRAVGSPDLVGTLLTDTDGRFVFGPLAPGKYVLTARRKGYIEQLYKQHEGFSTAIIVGDGLETENLRFGLPARASVSGQVFDERHDPVRNAQVMVFRRDMGAGKLATHVERQVGTDDQGRYRVGNLSPGIYFVGTSAQPWYAQHMSRQRQQQFDPASGATIEVPGPSPDPALDVVYPTTFFSNAGELRDATPITLHPGDTQIADLSLRPVPAMHVLIRNAPTDPSGERTLSVQASLPLVGGADQPVNATETQIAPGVLEVSGLPPGQLTLTLTSSKGNESTTRLRTLQLAADTEMDAAETVSSAAISGAIKIDDGSPFAQPPLFQLRESTTGVTLYVQCDLNGEFKSDALAPGTYNLFVLQPSGAAVRKLSATGAKASGHTLEIGSGQDVHLTVIISKGSGQVTGIARKDGQSADGVMVVLVPQDFERNPEFFRRDQSDSDGSFNLYAVLPGNYTLVAIENGWDLEWRNPDVLKKYLAAGEKVQISVNGKVEAKVNVQQ